MVIRKSSRDQSNKVTIVSGTGSWGSSAAMLSGPRGIFVTSSLDLYVADCGNDRIQLFRFGQINATTVVGRGSNSTMTIDCPHGITFDADGNLFIVSSYQHRVIVVGPGGVRRCIVGCTGTNGSAANQLLNPATLAFDIEGNLFVEDHWNQRIQKFQLIGRNQCGEYNREKYTTFSIPISLLLAKVSFRKQIRSFFICCLCSLSFQDKMTVTPLLTSS